MGGLQRISSCSSLSARITLGAPNRLVSEGSLFVFPDFFLFWSCVFLLATGAGGFLRFFFSSTSEITFSFLYIYPPVRLVFFLFYKKFQLFQVRHLLDEIVEISRTAFDMTCDVADVGEESTCCAHEVRQKHAFYHTLARNLDEEFDVHMY